MATLKIRLRKKGEKLNDRIKAEISRIINIINLLIKNDSNIFEKEENTFNLEVVPHDKYNDLKGLVYAYNYTLTSSDFQQKNKSEREKALIHYRDHFELILNQH